MKNNAIILLLLISVSACTMQTPTAQVSDLPPPAAKTSLSNTDTIYRNFNRVVRRMEPVVENVCNTTIPNENCDFKIVVDTAEATSPNAYQSLDGNRRPVITFNTVILRDVRNDDELAFVLGHEAAHHIRQHIPKQINNAVAGAIVFGGLAAKLGGSSRAISTAQDIGTFIGARGFSKPHELEADYLGAQLAELAGYDAMKGVAYFERIPDPGDVFLGTHPPNPQRIETVRRAVGG